MCSRCGRFDGFEASFPRLFRDCFFALDAAVHSRWLCNWLAKFSAGFGLHAVERGISNVGYNWRIVRFDCLSIKFNRRYVNVISLSFRCVVILRRIRIPYFIYFPYRYFVSIFVRLNLFLHVIRNCFSKC